MAILAFGLIPVAFLLYCLLNFVRDDSRGGRPNPRDWRGGHAAPKGSNVITIPRKTQESRRA